MSYVVSLAQPFVLAVFITNFEPVTELISLAVYRSGGRCTGIHRSGRSDGSIGGSGVVLRSPEVFVIDLSVAAHDQAAEAKPRFQEIQDGGSRQDVAVR